MLSIHYQDVRSSLQCWTQKDYCSLDRIHSFQIFVFDNCQLKWKDLVLSGVKKLQCEICPFQCNRKRNLERHLESHLPSEDRVLFGCTDCNSTFTQKVSLRIHVEKKHDKPLTDFKTLTAAEESLNLSPQSQFTQLFTIHTVTQKEWIGWNDHATLHTEANIDRVSWISMGWTQYQS